MCVCACVRESVCRLYFQNISSPKKMTKTMGRVQGDCEAAVGGGGEKLKMNRAASPGTCVL